MVYWVTNIEKKIRQVTMRHNQGGKAKYNLEAY